MSTVLLNQTQTMFNKRACLVDVIHLCFDKMRFAQRNRDRIMRDSRQCRPEFEIKHIKMGETSVQLSCRGHSRWKIRRDACVCPPSKLHTTHYNRSNVILCRIFHDCWFVFEFLATSIFVASSYAVVVVSGGRFGWSVGGSNTMLLNLHINYLKTTFS